MLAVQFPFPGEVSRAVESVLFFEIPGQEHGSADVLPDRIHHRGVFSGTYREGCGKSVGVTFFRVKPRFVQAEPVTVTAPVAALRLALQFERYLFPVLGPIRDFG